MITQERIYQKSPVWLQQVWMNAHAVRIQRERYGSKFAQLSGLWEKTERWNSEDLKMLQDVYVRDIVAFAYANVPYYKRKFDEHGVLLSQIQGVGDLHLLPILTKYDVRTARMELTAFTDSSASSAVAKTKLVHGHTSGTTGSPLDVWYDKTMCVVNNVADWRQKRWGGMTQADWCGVFLGRVVAPVVQRHPPFWRVNHLQKQVWFSSFHMSDDLLGACVEEIKKRGLRFLEGYPSTLYILARYVLRKGETLPMRSVFTSSETLHQVQRDAMSEAFGCPVFDFYGLAERVIFAGECEEHDGKHLFGEYGVTEIIDREGNPVPDGRPGWLAGTTLWNRGMPLIRYVTGDISTQTNAPCRCGRTLSRITGVATKAEDIIVTPRGRYISPSVLTHPFKPFHQLSKSQIIQESLNKITLKLVPSAEFTSEHAAELVSGLRARLEEPFNIEVQVVDDIPPERSGKFRWVISKVDHSCSIPSCSSDQTYTFDSSQSISP